MSYASFPSTEGNTTFYVVGDKDSVASLIDDLKEACNSQHLKSAAVSKQPIAYDEDDKKAPQPESVVRYFRASSAALALAGYIDQSALEDEGAVKQTPLPDWADQTLLSCMQKSIKESVPLCVSNDAPGLHSPPSLGLLVLLIVLFNCRFT